MPENIWSWRRNFYQFRRRAQFWRAECLFVHEFKALTSYMFIFKKTSKRESPRFMYISF